MVVGALEVVLELVEQDLVVSDGDDHLVGRHIAAARCHNLSVGEVPVPLGRYAWGKTSEVGRDG